MKYEAYDYYEGQRETLGTFDTIREARKAIRDRERETDGECSCYINCVDEAEGR